MRRTGHRRGSAARASQYGVGMRLLPIPDASGIPQLWINADHLVSVQLVTRGSEVGLVAEVEVKVDGMPLQRVPLGDFDGRGEAEEAFSRFRQVLENERPLAD